MKNGLIIVTLALFSLFIACQKDSAGIEMKYQITQCGDPWMRDTTYTNNKERVLKAFLQNKGITVIYLSITTNCSQAATCLACNCKGCDTAIAEVIEADITAMEALGFRR